MPRIILFLMASLYGSLALAQQLQREIDSLSVLLERQGTPDTLRLNWLNELAYLYYAIDPAKGLDKAEEAISLAKRLDDKHGLALAYSRKGINHWARGEDSLAMIASNQSLHLHQALGNWLNYAKGLNNRALNHYNKANYLAAIQDHEEAIVLFKRLDDKVGLQHSYLNMGVVYLALDDYPRALDVFLQAQRIDRQDDAMQANIWVNLGLVYKNSRDFPKAINCQQQALNLYRHLGNVQGEANALGNLAQLYQLRNEPDQAVLFYRRALARNRLVGNERRIAADLLNMGAVYDSAGKADSAALYLHMAVSTYARTNDKKGHAAALLQLAGTYPPLSEKRLLMEKQAVQLAEESGSPLQQSEALKALSETYGARRDFESALRLYKQQAVLRDSVLNMDAEKQIVRKQMEYDFEKRTALARSEISRQVAIRNAFFFSGVFLLIAVMLSWVFYKRKRDAEERKRKAEYERVVAETELGALRAQINPHFIFNSLNAIADCLAREDAVMAHAYLIKFAKLMRKTLENAGQKEILLADDLKFLDMYFQVERQRLQDKFSYHIQIDQSIDPDNVYVPPMLLQPFIENSIWHGITYKEGKGHIRVDIRKDGDILVCSVEDDGVGLQHTADGDTDAKPKSFGIRLTEERLAILGKQQQIQGHLSIAERSEAGGVRVEMRLPFKLAF